ncbi:MAG: sirohydrochlorin cobaltochelatase, partial [Cloacibacillus sp.]|nr:sirohydrochlorin cobaltochelatase [Cloacibacillus sp.]
YTSNIIRRKIAKEQNVNIPTPTSALAQMNDEGFTHVYVMPMHIIPGEEYDDIAGLVNGVAAVKGKYEFKELKLGRPYLSSAADCVLMAVGRVPNTEGLNDEKIGIDFEKASIKTDDRLRTNIPNIYAIGDV